MTKSTLTPTEKAACVRLDEERQVRKKVVPSWFVECSSWEIKHTYHSLIIISGFSHISVACSIYSVGGFIPASTVGPLISQEHRTDEPQLLWPCPTQTSASARHCPTSTTSLLMVISLLPYFQLIGFISTWYRVDKKNLYMRLSFK